MQSFWDALNAASGIIWHDWVLYIVLGTGVLFTLWSGFGQYRALTHGSAVIRGKYDEKDDPGAINHFQALSAALSATVGLGNIGGVALAVAAGGPGAIFWMWIVGLLGMSLKMTEVTLSMLDRNTDDPDNPHGGPMWVAQKGMGRLGLKPLGTIIGGIFVITLLVSAFTGGNMFQAWSVADVTQKEFGVPGQVSGLVMTVLVAMVIIGGVKRIGAVAGRLVPLMCGIYLLAALYVIVMNIGQIPAMFGLIFKHAFAPTEATGAFIGGTMGYAFAMGMKRALFSSEAGQGSSPIAHSAAKTGEPVREGVVAGLEPFIDTIVVCTLTALVLLSTGAWNREAEANFAADNPIAVVQAGGQENTWTLSNSVLPERTVEAKRIEGEWGSQPFTVYMVLEVDEEDSNTGSVTRKITGAAEMQESGEVSVVWGTIESATRPVLRDNGVHVEYTSASLTSHAFNRVVPGFGTYLVVLASWLFAISTMISWSYYGEQGVVFLFGDKAVLPYKIVYCGAILLSTAGFITTLHELDTLTTFGTGVMLWANIPIMLIFGATAMGAYHSYIKKLKAGEFVGHEPASITDVAEGKDVE
ncbi:MAG: amino acid carrier protein [Planctomycetota bacterium]